MLLQVQKTSLRTIPTAHLAQTMSLLELTNGELCQKIESALASNPALELLEDARCPHCHRILPPNGPCPICSHPKLSKEDDCIVFVSPRQDLLPYKQSFSGGDDMPAEEWTAASEDLPTYVLKQIAPELEKDERVLAAHILTSLNEDGLLEPSLVEIARYHHVPIAKVARVQRLIQFSDPLGVGSCTPTEALKIQVEALGEYRSVPPMTMQIIEEGMDLLGRKAYIELSRKFHISTALVVKIADFISSNLYPFPARGHWGEYQPGGEKIPTYTDADVIISQVDNLPEAPLMVEIISPYAGSLRVNPMFREALRDAPEDKLEEWEAVHEEATLLVKCLQQRNNTMVRLMKNLVTLQHEFILHGDAFLKPVTRAQLAVSLGVHESTISRAVAGKAVQLPNKRIVPLAKWFDRSLNIRTALMQIIAEEDEPLNDTELAERLLEQGFNIARRTVAKYRSIEGILPARLRQANLSAS